MTERGLFRDADPFGFILFKRNCENAEQIRYLILELQQAVGRHGNNRNRSGRRPRGAIAASELAEIPGGEVVRIDV